MLPPGLRASFEMVEAEFGLELLILLLDRPALMREADQLLIEAVAGRSTKKYFVTRRGARDPVRTTARPRGPAGGRASRGRV